MKHRARVALGLARTPLHVPLRWLAAKLERYVDIADNYNNCDANFNGEFMLVRHAAPTWRVAFDVGANVGAWTELVLGHSPQCEVHCFEPARSSFAVLTERWKSHPSVRIVRAGVGASDGHLAFLDRGSLSGSSGFVDRPSVEMPALSAESTPVVALDSYCAREGVRHIDFLKIDTEGFEMEVFRGMARLLASKAVDLLQFEYGGTWLDARESLAHAVRMLRGYGYSVYRLLPDGLGALPPGGHVHDSFKYANFIAASEPTALRGLRVFDP